MTLNQMTPTVFTFQFPAPKMQPSAVRAACGEFYRRYGEMPDGARWVINKRQLAEWESVCITVKSIEIEVQTITFPVRDYPVGTITMAGRAVQISEENPDGILTLMVGE